MAKDKMCVVGACCLLCLLCAGARATLVEYNVEDLGGSVFKYEYTITNDSLIALIEEFTIWFDAGLYDNLSIITEEPLASLWDEIILEKTGFGLPMGYDAQALPGNPGVAAGEAVHGFSVSFDWLGTEQPGQQFFEIINPATLETVDSGYTVPEPGTFLLLGLGGASLCRKRRA